MLCYSIKINRIRLFCITVMWPIKIEKSPDNKQLVVNWISFHLFNTMWRIQYMLMTRLFTIILSIILFEFLHVKTRYGQLRSFWTYFCKRNKIENRSGYWVSAVRYENWNKMWKNMEVWNLKNSARLSCNYFIRT